MKILPTHLTALTAIATLAFASAALSGNVGPGPWANGAYYPGQFDGTYTATVYANAGTTNGPTNSTSAKGAVVYSGTVVSGVVGFALTGGSPRTVGEGASAVVDTNRNYYAIFANGYSFVGVTYANVDISQKTVAGTFAASETSFVNPPFTERYLNGGSFVANVNSDQAMFTFSGNGLLSTSISPMGPTKEVNWTDGVQFDISGIKVGN